MSSGPCAKIYRTLGLKPKTVGFLRQTYAAATVSNAVIIAGNMMAWPSPTLPLLLSPESPVPMTAEDASWMISLMYIGNLCSPIPCGHLMNRIGRKSTLLYLNIFSCISWLLIISRFSSVYMIYIARFLAGIWLGIVYTVVPIYLGEIAEPRIRGSLSTCFAIMIYVGVLMEYVVGPYVTYDVLAYFSFFFCVLFSVVFYPMPETPYFLMKINRKEDAKKSLFWLRGDDPNVDEELNRIEASVIRQNVEKGTLKDILFNAANRKAFFIVAILSFLQRFSGTGTMVAYASITLPEQALGLIGTNECVIILGSVWVLSTFFSSFFIDKVGRKVLLVISAIGCTVFTFLAGLWFYLNQKYPDSTAVQSCNWVPFVCFIIHGIFYSIGLNPIVTTIKGELFSSSIKETASAITTIPLAITSALLNKSYQTVADYVGMYLNYWIYSVGCFAAAIFSQTYVVETRGKSLQEIQDKMNRNENVEEVTRL